MAEFPFVNNVHVVFAVIKYLFIYIFIFRDYPKLNMVASPWNSYRSTHSTANSLVAKAIETTVVAGGQTNLWKHLGLVNCSVNTLWSSLRVSKLPLI